MNICILDNDTLEGELAHRYTSFGAMFVQLFDNVGAQWTYDIFSTQRGEYPASFDAYDAVLLTGSASDAFSDEAWVVELRRRVTQLLVERKKMVGVCFGHQLIGLCMGAPVGRAPQGWGKGRMAYDWHRQDLPGCQDRQQIALYVSHQDQVVNPPVGAVTLARSAHTDHAMLAYEGAPVISIQGHPEFSDTFVSALWSARRGKALTDAQVDGALASLARPGDADLVAAWMTSFLRGAR